MGDIKIIENISELGAGTRGASLGVGSLKVVAQNLNTSYFGKYECFKVAHENDRLNASSSYPFAKYIDGMLNIYQNTADVVKHVLAQGDFPIVLAGDHSSAGGTMAGIKSQYPNKRLGVIWVDAHADLHTPFTTPSGNIHGMPLATAVCVDNIECKINEPTEETVSFWNRLKQLGGVTPKVQPNDLVFVAVRDTEPAEDELIKKHEIKNYPVDEMRPLGIKNMIEEIKAKLQDCDIVYVSFDVDSMDCDLVSKGTGTPVEHGLTADEAHEIMELFADWRKVACIEVVEINPCLDDKINTMAETAYKILDNFTHHVENRL
jgi:arginase